MIVREAQTVGPSRSKRSLHWEANIFHSLRFNFPGSELESKNIPKVPGGYHIPLSGTRTRLGGGDELDPSPSPSCDR